MADRPTVHGRPAAIPDGWIAIYRRFRTALLGHVIDEGFVDEQIRPLFPGIHVVGTAITVRLPDGDLELHCHPDLSTLAGRAECAALRSSRFRDALGKRGVILATYRSLPG